MHRLDADRFLEDLTGRYARIYAEAVHDLYVATVLGDKVAAREARVRLEETMRETMGIGEVLGASLALQKAAAVLREVGAFRESAGAMMRFASEPTQTILPRVTLTEAVQDMVDRTPVTIRRAAERTALRIAQLYSEGRVTAFVYAAEQAVTEEAQQFIRRALREGIPEGEAGRKLAMSVDQVRVRSAAWSEAYARMAFRTNINTAVTAGRFRQARDPDVRAVVPALRFDAVGDDDTRDNHDAADGWIFKVDNPVWNKIAPPLGYNCRCRVSLISLPMLERMGRIDKNGDVIESRPTSRAFPDPGFRHGGRPDLFMVDAVA